MLRRARLDHAAIARLIPHQGAMCLLDSVQVWDARSINCHATSHASPDNPLRRASQLSPLAGIEYAMQAAALHGALTADAPQKPAFLAVLREVSLGCERLDDPAIQTLNIQAWLERAEASGVIYRFEVATQEGDMLVAGRAVIAKREELFFLKKRSKKLLSVGV